MPRKAKPAGPPVLLELEDLWAMADQAGKPKAVMTFEEMNAAKARRSWR